MMMPAVYASRIDCPWYASRRTSVPVQRLLFGFITAVRRIHGVRLVVVRSERFCTGKVRSSHDLCLPTFDGLRMSAACLFELRVVQASRWKTQRADGALPRYCCLLWGLLRVALALGCSFQQRGQVLLLDDSSRPSAFGFSFKIELRGVRV